MQTENGAVRDQLAQTIDGFLRKLEQAVSLASQFGAEPNHGRSTALQQPLATDFECVAQRWRKDKLISLTDTAAVYLLELAETLDQRMHRIVNASKPTGATTADTPPSSQLNGAEIGNEKVSRCGDKYPSAKAEGRHPARLDGGVRSRHSGLSSGTLKHRTLVSFLESHGFQKDSKQTGECVYRHESGARLSIPPRHSKGEISKGTTCKVLRRIGQILESDARLFGGQIVVAQGQ